MARITKIEVARDFTEKKKTRVAAYARVSTKSDEQLLSLETQKEHYDNFISSNPEWEYADYYRVAALKKQKEAGATPVQDGGPWISEVPELSVYDWRGCRMLDKRCWSGKCFPCKWACMANVAIEYEWGLSQKFRFESFCYGPKNCPLYKMGRPRPVPYKGCGSVYDEGWLDEICTENRNEEE